MGFGNVQAGSRGGEKLSSRVVKSAEIEEGQGDDWPAGEEKKKRRSRGEKGRKQGQSDPIPGALIIK